MFDVFLIFKCPPFPTERLQTDGTIAEGQLGCPGPARRVAAGGDARPAPGQPGRKGRDRSGEKRLPVAGVIRKPFLQVRIEKSFREGPGEFHRLLSSLLAAGVPLSRALVILCKEASSPAAGAKWKEVHDSVVDGVSLFEAMGRSPETFPRVYTAMVEAGEAGGFLDLVLAQIADFKAREKEMKSR